MKVLVTGATGFLGSHVVEVLKKEGIDFRCLARMDSNTNFLESLSAPISYGDLREKGSLKNALKDVDTVLHMAGVIKSSSRKTYYDVNYLGTKSLVEACKKLGVRRFVHVSTQDIIFSLGDYSISKMMGESIVRSSGLDFTILRPTAIYGDGEGSLKELACLIKTMPIVPIIGSGTNKFQPVYVDDVAKAVLKVLKARKTIGKIYSLGGSERISFNGMTDIIMREFGVKKPKLHIPSMLAELLIRTYELSTDNPSMTACGIKLMGYDKICDNSSAIKDFGYNPIGFKKGVKYLVKSMR
jgi:nucleoside-diphosphate-sugar epimerase